MSKNKPLIHFIYGLPAAANYAFETDCRLKGQNAVRCRKADRTIEYPTHTVTYSVIGSEEDINRVMGIIVADVVFDESYWRYCKDEAFCTSWLISRIRQV